MIYVLWKSFFQHHEFEHPLRASAFELSLSGSANPPLRSAILSTCVIFFIALNSRIINEFDYKFIDWFENFNQIWKLNIEEKMYASANVVRSAAQAEIASLWDPLTSFLSVCNFVSLSHEDFWFESNSLFSFLILIN